MAELRTEEEEARQYKLVIQALFLAVELTGRLAVACERGDGCVRLTRTGMKVWSRYYRRRALLPGGEALREEWEAWAAQRVRVEEGIG